MKSIEAPVIETTALAAVLEMLVDPERLAEYQTSYDAEYSGETAVDRMRAKLAELTDRIAIEAKAVLRAS